MERHANIPYILSDPFVDESGFRYAQIPMGRNSEIAYTLPSLAII
jgi:hypothetical protein